MTETLRRHIIRATSILVLYELDTTSNKVPAILNTYLNIDVEEKDARVNAFQALCAFDVDKNYDEDKLPTDISLSEREVRMLHALVTGVNTHHEELDKLIKEFATEWPTAQIAFVDRNILRVAIYEIVYRQVPLKVVINEAVEIAKIYGGDSSPRFVNGVLGALAQSLDTPDETSDVITDIPANDDPTNEEFQAESE